MGNTLLQSVVMVLALAWGVGGSFFAATSGAAKPAPGARKRMTPVHAARIVLTVALAVLIVVGAVTAQ